MIDLAYIRENIEALGDSAQKRGIKIDFQEFLKLDESRRELIAKVEALRARRNEVSAQTTGGKPSQEQISEVKQLKEELAGLEAKLDEAQGKLNDIARDVPNLLPSDTPLGGEENNKTEHTWGPAIKHDFEAKDHLTLGLERGWLDFERGTKVAGSKFYFLMGDLVRLEMALSQFVMDEAAKLGFVPMQVPHLVNTRMAEGTGYAPRGEERQTYKIEGEDLNLIATSEVPLTAFHADETIDVSEARLYMGVSPAYRMEAGAYGRYNKGLYRVHQFNKLEAYIYCEPSESEKWHQKLLHLEQTICELLEIPYQVVRIAAGDLGAPALKKYDVEYWSPAEGQYRELMSCSNVTDYQARRLNIKSSEGGLVHTLNATALAMSRGLIAIMDNHQQADGKLRIPEVLRSYLGNKEVL